MAWAVAGLVIAAIVGIVWSSWRGVGRAERAAAKLEGLFQEAGAEPLPGGAWLFKERRYGVWIEPPTFFSSRSYLRIGLYTPRVWEFSLREAQGVGAPAPATFADDPLYKRFDLQTPTPKELEKYLDRPPVRCVLQKAMLGRWKELGQRSLLLAFEDNWFDERAWTAPELAATLQALTVLDDPPQVHPRGGILTYRGGFESDLPPWHWPLEELKKLSKETGRFVLSYYRNDPYLNEALAEILLELCGEDARPCFLTDLEDISFLEHAFGPCYRKEGAVVELRSAVAAAAAERFTEGGFFQGFAALPKGTDESLFASGRRHTFHETACARIRDLKFAARRLLNDEASWLSGEIEILTVRLQPEQVRKAVEGAAERHGAQVRAIDRRFSLKLFRDETFEYSA